MTGPDRRARPRKPAPAPKLAREWIVPPFSVLDCRQGYWRARKAAWERLGVHEEAGRAEGLTWSRSAQPPSVVKRKNALEAQLGRVISWEEFALACPDSGALEQTSRFDPVIAELAYSWFSPPGGVVLDPFAGGSVRGLVAATLGRPYLGIELRPEQVEANERAADAARPAPRPVWQTGDAGALTAAAGEVDFVFSCPPYGDLEVYSDDPRDLSRMPWPRFVAAYRQIIAAAVAVLRADRFAAFVVGDVRDRRGIWRGLPALTSAAFADAGARLYNEAVIIPMLGSLPVRAGRQFTASRKLGRAHQWLLVFVKGDPAAAVAAVGSVVPIDLEQVA